MTPTLIVWGDCCWEGGSGHSPAPRITKAPAEVSAGKLPDSTCDIGAPGPARPERGFWTPHLEDISKHKGQQAHRLADPCCTWKCPGRPRQHARSTPSPWCSTPSPVRPPRDSSSSIKLFFYGSHCSPVLVTVPKGNRQGVCINVLFLIWVREHTRLEPPDQSWCPDTSRAQGEAQRPPGTGASSRCALTTQRSCWQLSEGLPPPRQDQGRGAWSWAGRQASRCVRAEPRCLAG